MKKTRGLLIGFSLLIGVLIFSRASSRASNKAEVPAAPAQGSADLSIVGEWQGNTGIRYTIRQDGASFTWWAAAIHEKATGTIRGRELSASWEGDNGSHSATARITSEDGNGRATRIEFSNGAVFTRPGTL
ncbi:MAG: hypothetical protein ABSF14_04090 [Terriglobia bacterium]|jgi:hypothetical protein